MKEKTRQVILNLPEDDCKWLEEMFGESWKERMEQHIRNEVHLRKETALQMRTPWDY